MLTVHHLGVSQSDRVVWLCEELGIDYELKTYARDPVTRLAPAEYKALHPCQTAPVITDGDIVLGETTAIFDYIIARYGSGRLKPAADAANFADFLYWYHFANGSFLPAGMTDIVLGMLGMLETPAVAPLRARGHRAYEMVEARLGEARWFAGDEFTAADIMMVFPLTTMRMFAPRDLQPYPNIRAYLLRVAERPAWRTAMAKSDPGFEPPLN